MRLCQIEYIHNLCDYWFFKTKMPIRKFSEYNIHGSYYRVIEENVGGMDLRVTKAIR